MGILKVGLLFLILLRFIASMRSISGGKFEAFTSNDFSLHIKYWRSKHSIDGLTFRTAIPDKLRFILRRETAVDRIARNLGIASEWQTGDAGFDEKVFILSEDMALNRALARDEELRKVCVELLGAHKDASIECRAGELYLGFSAPYVNDKKPAVLRRRFAKELRGLLKLHRCLERIRADAWSGDRDPALARKAWLVGISLSLGIAGFAALLFNMNPDQHQVVREAIPRLTTITTLLVVGALLAGTFFWLRSTPHTHGVLLDILLAAAPGCWVLAGVFVVSYNQRLDTSPPRKVPVRVVDTYSASSSSHANRFLLVQAWPDPRGQREMGISWRDFEWIRPGSCITATWHAGRLGDGWVSRYERGCASAEDVER